MVSDNMWRPVIDELLYTFGCVYYATYARLYSIIICRRLCMSINNALCHYISYRIVKGCVREVSLPQVNCMFMLLRGCVVNGLGATAAH